LTSFALSKNDDFEVPDQFLSAAYYRRLGPRAVRLDILERVESVLIEAAKHRKNADEVMNVLVSLLGCGHADALALATLLGWRRETHEVKSGDIKTATPVWQRARGPRPQKHQRAGKPVKPDSPFAALATLIPID